MKPQAFPSFILSPGSLVVKNSSIIFLTSCCFFVCLIIVHPPIYAQEAPATTPSVSFTPEIVSQPLPPDEASRPEPSPTIGQFQLDFKSPVSSVSSPLLDISQFSKPPTLLFQLPLKPTFAPVLLSPDTDLLHLPARSNLQPIQADLSSNQIRPDSSENAVSVSTNSGSLRRLITDCLTCSLTSTLSASVEATVSAAIATPFSEPQPPVSFQSSLQLPAENLPIAYHPQVRKSIPQTSNNSSKSPDSPIPISTSGPASMPSATTLAQSLGSGGFGPSNWISISSKVFLPIAFDHYYFSVYWITGLFLISMRRFVRLKSGRSPAFNYI